FWFGFKPNQTKNHAGLPRRQLRDGAHPLTGLKLKQNPTIKTKQRTTKKKGEGEMENERLLERERQQMEQIRQLEFEVLQVEEVDASSDDDRNATGAASSGEYTFNTCLASLHTYLGEVDDTHGRIAFLDGGTIFTLPLFYLEGVVLFPEATLPLRVIQPNFIAAVERAMTQVDAPLTIGVLHVCTNDDNGRTRLATTGTTAEIRQYRRLEDGSLNVVTRGQQRFRLKRCWIDVEGAPCGEVQIVQEDLPLRTPRDAFGKLGPLSNIRSHNFPRTLPATASSRGYADGDNDSETNSEDGFETELSLAERKMHKSVIDSCYGYDVMDESTSSDDDKFVCESDVQFRGSDQNHFIASLHLDHNKQIANAGLGVGKSSTPGGQYHKRERPKRYKKSTEFNQLHKVPRAFWPYWVYRMYDSYCLAQRAADMWKQIVGTPSMKDLVDKPDYLSFYLASQIPVSESIRQELLEIDGISYRLRREIELLESFDRIRCKNCQTVIARRSDMLVMSSEGPLGAYVNPNGCVHEIMTLYKSNGLALVGQPVIEYSWFPGYAWTITHCATCETHIGWLFTATKSLLKPRSFWGIRAAQVGDDMR
ncbi:LON domain-containing protein, partial [Cephalotus follicularis]